MEQETKKTALSTPAAIVIAGVIIALAVIFTNRPATNQAANKTPQAPTEMPKLSVRDDDRVDGDISKAQIVIFEYSDSDCPFCQRFHPVMKQVRTEYGDKIAWVYRYYPLEALHPNAFNEAVALECAASIGGNEGFWKYMDIAIEKTFEATDKANLEKIAGQIGLEKELFARCLTTNAIAERVRRDAAEAQTIGAQGTPFSIALDVKTGKQTAIPGAYPIEEMRSLINSLLK